jgi:RNA 2',3'-cyclic 3'-phosphodiesterase
MEFKRLFVGIGFSDRFAKSVETWTKKIRKTADQKEIFLKWTPPDNYHVTLVFLGNTPVNDIPRIQETIQQVAENHSSFQLKIRDISGFPTVQQARVLYLGVQRSQALLDLQTNLESTLLPLDKADHEYSPHLTIARLRNPKSCRDLLSPFAHIDLGKQEVDSVALFQTKLSNGFPTYEKLFRVELNQSSATMPT